MVMSVQATPEKSCTASVPVIPKTLWLVLVLVHIAGELGFASSHSQRSFVPVSQTLRVYEGPAAVKQSELCSVSHSREALGWACAIPSRGFQAGSQDSLVPAVYSKEVTSSNTSSSLGEVIGSLSDRYEF